MASTFSIQSRSYEGRYMRLSCVQEKDIANNRSKVTWTLSSIGGSAAHYTIAATTVKINGSVVYSIGRTSYTYAGFPSATGSVSGVTYVPHNDNGSKTVAVSLETNVYEWTPILYNGSWQLDDIPRNAYITSAPDFNDNSNPIVSYSNPLGNSASGLDICITLDGSKDDIPYRPIDKNGKSYTFNLTDDERDILRNATSGTSRNVGFSIRTVISSGKLYNIVYKKFTIHETEKTKPSVSLTAEANNGTLPSAFSGLYIQGKSKVNVEISAQCKYGASVKEYATVIDGNTYSESSFTSDYITESGDNVSIACKVTDTRGFTGSPSQTPVIKVYQYSSPKITNTANAAQVMCYRGNEDGTKNKDSTKVFLKAKKIFSAIDSLNNCTMRFRKKISESDTWGSWTILSTTDNEYNALLPGDFDLKQSYTIEVSVIDTVGDSDSVEFDIPTEDITFHLGEGGKAVGIGRYADPVHENRLSVAYETHFERECYDQFGTMIRNGLADYTGSAEDAIDPNITRESIILTDHANSPSATTGVFYYIQTFFFSDKSSNRSQIAIPYNSGSMYYRYFFDGTWSNWILIMSTNSEADYIIAQGTSGIWTYRKWNSGIAECWTTEPYTDGNNHDVVTSSWAGGYESSSGKFVMPQYPFKFVDVPAPSIELAYCDAEAYSGDIIRIEHFNLWGKETDLRVAPPTFKFWRGTTKLLGHPRVNIYSIGKWK